MPGVPEQLQQARLARRLSIQQVAELTKIRTDHIRALEEGRYEVFPAPVYVRGFVRTYAGLLKLDVPQIMAALDAELKQCPKFHEPEPHPVRRSTLLTNAVLLLGRLRLGRRAALAVALLILVSALAGLLIWRHLSARNKPLDIKPGVYSPPAAPADILPFPTLPRRQ
ncbi:MAG: helix-turn-helix domain-containing protein [Verrucomicrobiae bacterium]|nr:helix-turn-helix domain-containing protein [Verrucomicrobiae bacterium]MCX7722019.1 helix-turn-helix domain-containing protein [Verrucomicrobiae bacterium]MDW7979742.1 helix-turn-helix transcriptional regulator [Verrucomicrobiales bacterium]